MRSVSHHGDTEELLQLLLPILKVIRSNHNMSPPNTKESFGTHYFTSFQINDVDFYINGHDHCLEHISSRDRLISVLYKVNFHNNLELNMHVNIQYFHTR